jgi:bis(5'-nucleosyl)-tetraphosphatase (symmetrical)
VSTIVIGDVHGCLEELDELLTLIGARGAHDLVVLGDLMDRGPDPVGVVRRVRELGAACVMGNHDEKHVRWGRHEARRRADPDYANPMRPLSPDRRAQHDALGEAALSWLSALPLTLDLGGGWHAVHGGAVRSRPLRKQKDAILLRCRFVDDAGAMLSGTEPPPGAHLWATMWPGPESIVYGHHVHSLEAPRIDQPAPGVTCAGIDTGCCFGGRLTAFVVESGEVIQVPARRAYATLHEGEE